MNCDIKIKILEKNAHLPTYGSHASAGADLYSCLTETVTILPGDTKFISTGISLEIPEGYAGFIYARSGLASKRGLAPSNKVGVIDSDYRGEIIVSLHNHSKEAQTVSDGERIAQLVIAPYIRAEFIQSDNLSETQRGTGGFGSTGTK